MNCDSLGNATKKSFSNSNSSCGNLLREWRPRRSGLNCREPEGPCDGCPAAPLLRKKQKLPIMSTNASFRLSRERSNKNTASAVSCQLKFAQNKIAQVPPFHYILQPLFVTIDAYFILRAVPEEGSERGAPSGPPLPGGVPEAEIGCGEVIGSCGCCFPAVASVVLFRRRRRDPPDGPRRRRRSRPP